MLQFLRDNRKNKRGMKSNNESAIFMNKYGKAKGLRLSGKETMHIPPETAGDDG